MTPSSKRVDTCEARLLEHPEHLAVLGQGLGGELGDAPLAGGTAARYSSRMVARPRPWWLSSMKNATSAWSVSGGAVVARHADDLVGEDGDERHTVA
jgi:hypothetical protein